MFVGPRTKRIIPVSALILTFLAAPALAAEESPVRKANNVFWLAAGVNNLVHKDPTIQGIGLSTSEHGWLPSFELGGSYMGESGYFLSLSGDVTVGSSNYRGFDASFNPDTGTTDNTIFTVNGQFGWNISPFKTVGIIPYVEAGYSYWNRELQGNFEYTHIAALGGVKVQYAASDTTFVSTYAAFGRTLFPQADTLSGGYDPDEESTYKIGTKISYTPTLSPRYEYFIASEYNKFGYGENDSYPTDSWTKQWITRVGLGYRFK